MRNRGSKRRTGFLFLLAMVPVWTGCAGGAASYIHPGVDFGHIRRCAILPFENLTSDAFADQRMQSIFLMEALKDGSLVLLDPEETVSAMRELRIVPGSAPTPAQIVALGKVLSVEAVFLGSVEEYGLAGHSRQQIYQVTATFSMAETETGQTIWRSQVHVDGSSFWQKLFGGETASLYKVSRKVAQKALGSLF